MVAARRTGPPRRGSGPGPPGPFTTLALAPRDTAIRGEGFGRQEPRSGGDADDAGGHVRFYGPAYGYQGQAFAQLERGRGGYGYGYAQRRREVGWRGDGTGLVGLIGGGDDAAYPRSRRYVAEAPVQVTYGEPDLWSSGGGYPPTGGLAYYNSGSPGRMAYYGSSSSAGPYGTPGGLGIYSSGSYGAGPHIIRVGRRHVARARFEQGCLCGRPHIIALRRHVRHYARW